MSEEVVVIEKNGKKGKKITRNVCTSNTAANGGTYFLAFLGAFIFYVQQADTFGQGLWGFVKAIFWPGFLVYELLDFINK